MPAIDNWSCNAVLGATMLPQADSSAYPHMSFGSIHLNIVFIEVFAKQRSVNLKLFFISCEELADQLESSLEVHPINFNTFWIFIISVTNCLSLIALSFCWTTKKSL